MKSKYYSIIKICRQFTLLGRRIKAIHTLLFSGFLDTPSYYSDEKRKTRAKIVLEEILHILKYGYLESHYYAYGLDLNGHNELESYIDDNWFLWKCAMLNSVLPANDYSVILRDKSLFSLFLSNNGFSAVKEFAKITDYSKVDTAIDKILSSNGKLFCKPIYGQCGRGAFIIDVNHNHAYINGVEVERTDLSERLIAKPYLIQPYVVQHPLLSSVYEKSVNTIRLLSIMNPVTLEPTVIAGEIRFGSNGNVTDNLAAEGICVGINLASGQLNKYGMAKNGPASRRIDRHPDSAFPFEDISLPFWEDIVSQTKNLHRLLPAIRIIGWDIAITETGPLYIEGNDNPEIAGLQMANGGLKEKVKAALGNNFYD